MEEGVECPCAALRSIAALAAQFDGDSNELPYVASNEAVVEYRSLTAIRDGVWMLATRIEATEVNRKTIDPMM